jgi:hypothetical protein
MKKGSLNRLEIESNGAQVQVLGSLFPPLAVAGPGVKLRGKLGSLSSQ